MSTWKHVYQRIEEHESSQYHKQNTDAFLIHSSECDISFLLVRDATNIRKSQVIQKHKAMERIIDILMFIGKRGLSYRGNKAESAFLLDDPLIDHVHLDKVICESKKRHSSLCEGQKGRGSLITLIYKTTLNYILEAIHQLQLDLIVQEVKKAGIYSIQIDTTQDITTTDQCSVIIRYVTDQVHERLLAFVARNSSKGSRLFEMLHTILKTNKFKISHCVSDSTDGAANMAGQYNGLNAWIKQASPNHIHAIGTTRWWSKDRALKNIFGNWKDPFNALFVNLIEVLDSISKAAKMNAKARLFQVTTSLSEYLQTSGLDFIQAQGMTVTTIESLRRMKDEFESIILTANKLIESQNEKLELLDSDIFLDNSLPLRRYRKKNISQVMKHEMSHQLMHWKDLTLKLLM
ncbi:hypothetical protein LOD99_1540 [Oopsacas minuta]|uniref:DUF4371 domain-containing protein n=1 Tax=Oopsacas minuta TaxID=111878 RepID=A0AAV7K4S0_9METZ|nr:hypothetical protein LOD99_1540 [Oopsacas minuta]